MVGGGAGAETGVQAFKTVLKNRYRSFSVYLRKTGAAAGRTATKTYSLESLASWPNNFNLKDKKESRKVTKEHFRRGRPRSQTEVILIQTFF